jgi:hypothetical protein
MLLYAWDDWRGERDKTGVNQKRAATSTATSSKRIQQKRQKESGGKEKTLEMMHEDIVQIS